MGDSIETTSNPKGLCCVSVEGDRVVLVCPGMQQGVFLLVCYPNTFGEEYAGAEESFARERTTIVTAHESPLAAMCTDLNGTLLATASCKGTIIRVFDTAGGSRLQELRRGADRAEIHSLTFSHCGSWLVTSSDKGTIHVFAVCRPALGIGSLDSSLPGNAKSNLQRISKVLPAYFSSEWSFAQFRVPDYRAIASFGTDPNIVVIVCASGSFYKARFDPVRGGEMVREEFAQFDDASVEEINSTLGTLIEGSREASQSHGGSLLASIEGCSGGGACGEPDPQEDRSGTGGIL